MASSSSSSKPVHILVVGAGAVGCFYASKLHIPERNIHVSLVCRSNYKAIAANGVSLETHSFGNYHFRPHAVFSSIQHAADHKASKGGDFQWDFVIVTTKALPDITNDAHDIRALVTPGLDGSCIVLIQNGVGIEEVHRVEFPQNPVVSAVTVISAEQIRHGVIRQNRWTRITMGTYTNGQAKPNEIIRDQSVIDSLSSVTDGHIRNLVEWFTSTGIRDAEHSPELDLQLTRWHKLCINASMNPSSVLSGGTTNSRMSLDPELRIHLEACMNEIFSTAPRILGVSFDDKKHASPQRILKSTERNTSGKPSMLVDWLNSRPMELEVILGNPIRIARRNGLEMPRLQSLYALLKMAQTRKQEDASQAESKSKAKL
ncbi:2-dehydropantoate 2-reductase [Testicularia cyperi]|uniref:2-dehydropantoate 2-reductase n=1 Tax=Testicularia cyperi TaxID=1882483 RepID=A0A317XRH1_9BASI|nr:2-dehydropantoate 2-reductase [Testicularia cyperi]